MGCERSERREPTIACIPLLGTFSGVLKPKQPHPNPPLLPQGRECIVASIRLYRLVTLWDE